MKLNGWRRLAIVLGGAWVIGIATLTSYEVLSQQDGVFAGLSPPGGTIVTGNTATPPDGRTKKPNIKLNGKDVKPWGINRGNEVERPIEIVVRWKVLIPVITLPIVLWLVIEALVKIGDWIGRGFGGHKAP